MKAALLHYHLKPGGVTTVIRQQIEALSGHSDLLLLTGKEPPEPVGCPYSVVPGIGYDGPENPDEDPHKTASRIIREIRTHFPGGCDVLHIHNPLLAKNRRLPAIISSLRQRGMRLLLQVHDLAEDGRPDVFYSEEPYPEDCHYCVINSRDREILLKAGLKKEGLHLLANMVNFFDTEPEKTIRQNFVLYPVRAIRRKNIGEAVLISLFLDRNASIAVTLPPNSPRDWGPYNQWKKFVKERDLPIVFEASRKYHFQDLVKSAESFITTSVSEGFGFAFLEPWTAGQLLSGRRLPDICRDFEEKGVALDHLYTRLDIPLEAFDSSRFFEKWRTCIMKNAGRYGLEMESGSIAAAYNEITKNGCIDFGLLDEPFQQQAVLNALRDPGIYRRIRDANPGPAGITDTQDRSTRISRNRAAVASNYGLEAYRNRLKEIHRQTVQTSVSQRIDKKKLALEFLRPQNFSMLKWSDDRLY